MPGSFPASPDTDNGYIGTGIIYFSEDDGATFRDLGEGPTFVITPNVTTKEQKSSRGGVKSTWIERITEVKQEIKFDLLEWTPDNLAYFFLSDVDSDSDGNKVLLGLTTTNVQGILKFVGDNDVGQRITWEGTVQFIPSGPLNLLEEGDDFGKISLTAKVLKGELGEYGKATIRGVDGTE